MVWKDNNINLFEQNETSIIIYYITFIFGLWLKHSKGKNFFIGLQSTPTPFLFQNWLVCVLILSAAYQNIVQPRMSQPYNLRRSRITSDHKTCYLLGPNFIRTLV